MLEPDLQHLCDRLTSKLSKLREERDALKAEAKRWEEAFAKAVGVGVPIPKVLEKMSKDRDQWRDAAQKELDRANETARHLSEAKAELEKVRTGYKDYIDGIAMASSRVAKEIADLKSSLSTAQATIAELTADRDKAFGHISQAHFQAFMAHVAEDANASLRSEISELKAELEKTRTEK